MRIVPTTVYYLVLMVLVVSVLSVVSNQATANAGSVYFTGSTYPTTLRNRSDTVPYGVWVSDMPPKKDTATVNKQLPEPSTSPRPVIDPPEIRRLGPESSRAGGDTVDRSGESRSSSDTLDKLNAERTVEPPASTSDYNQGRNSASGGRRSVNIGIQYPGITLGFRRPGYSFEFKALHDNDITILGVRYYHHLWQFESGNIYWTSDLSTVTFEGDVSSGDGISTGVAGGVEKFFGQGFSWTMDVGPYYTFLDDEDTNFDEDGLEFVVTTALNFHFN